MKLSAEYRAYAETVRFATEWITNLTPCPF
jgi:hypothetical protein